MKTPDLVFVGIRGTVLALHRSTGELAWETRLKGSDFVNVILDKDRIFASVYGEVFCLDSATGQIRWHNKLKGFGTGLASIATPGGLNPSNLYGEKRRRDQASADAAAAATAAT